MTWLHSSVTNIQLKYYFLFIKLFMELWSLFFYADYYTGVVLIY